MGTMLKDVSSGLALSGDALSVWCEPGQHVVGALFSSVRYKVHAAGNRICVSLNFPVFISCGISKVS